MVLKTVERLDTIGSRYMCPLHGIVGEFISGKYWLGYFKAMKYCPFCGAELIIEDIFREVN